MRKNRLQAAPGTHQSNSIGWMIQILIVATWAFIQYLLGHTFYAIFLFVFFAALLFLRPKNFGLVAVSVLVIVLFNTEIINSLVQLKRWNLNSAQNYPRVLGNLFLPNAGQEKVLSDEVQQMLRLLRENDVTDYRLSPEFASDMKIQQRITEAAWPIRPQGRSNYLLGSLEQIQNEPACTIIDTEKDVALANCQ